MAVQLGPWVHACPHALAVLGHLLSLQRRRAIGGVRENKDGDGR
jgi:hypothetical protein